MVSEYKGINGKPVAIEGRHGDPAMAVLFAIAARMIFVNFHCSPVSTILSFISSYHSCKLPE